jgi:hypothetical protein
MVLTREEKHKAYIEAKNTLELGQKWQRLVPGERRPNFEKAAATTLRNALGHKTAEHRHVLDISNRLMHQHEPATARILERTLQNGIVHPDVLHSFRDDYRTAPRGYPKPPRSYLHPGDAVPELYISHDSDIDYVSHFNVNTGDYMPHDHTWLGHHVAHRPAPMSTVKTDTMRDVIV